MPAPNADRNRAVTRDRTADRAPAPPRGYAGRPERNGSAEYDAPNLWRVGRRLPPRISRLPFPPGPRILRASEEHEPERMDFTELGLGPDTLKAVADAGYREPTPIQAQAIPIVLQGRDVMGCAQTGTGKTASFTLPMIDILSAGRARARMPRSLILTPTRELATQIAENFEIYGKYHKLSKALLIGGVAMGGQRTALERGVDVLIATPGRILDLFERGALLLTGVKILVVDEADRMLDMGFIPDVERLIGLVSPIRQTLMFSATMPPEIRRLADKFLSSPREIHVAPPASPADLVEQSLVAATERGKREALRGLLRSEAVENALIFCNRKRDVDLLDRSLRRHGFSSAALHGDMPQPARTETLEAFKAGRITLLVATDVAGRGLDIQGLSHVFNFDTPFHAEDYVHRIGRTGRAGRRGIARTLATPEDAKFVAAIESLIGRAIPRAGAPREKTPARRAKPPAAADTAAKPARPAARTRAAAPKSRRRAKPAAKPAPAPEPEARTGMGGHVPAFLLTPPRASG